MVAQISARFFQSSAWSWPDTCTVSTSARDLARVYTHDSGLLFPGLLLFRISPFAFQQLCFPQTLVLQASKILSFSFISNSCIAQCNLRPSLREKVIKNGNSSVLFSSSKCWLPFSIYLFLVALQYLQIVACIFSSEFIFVFHEKFGLIGATWPWLDRYVGPKNIGTNKQVIVKQRLRDKSI